MISINLSTKLVIKKLRFKKINCVIKISRILQDLL
jgi:hypothetical protein